MNFSIKTIVSVVCVLLLYACDTYEVDIPEYNPQGNIIALLTPGEGTSIQAAITGPSVETVRDTQRVKSNLYENGVLVDRFALKSNYPIKWNACYALEVNIDNRYFPSSEICIGDSLQLSVLDTTRLEDVMRDDIGGGTALNYIKSVELKSQSNKRQFYYYGNPLSTFHFGTSIYPNGKKYAQLPPHQIDTIEVYTRIPEDVFVLTQYSESYSLFILSQESADQRGNVNPGPVTYSNVENGVGFMSLFYQYEI